MASNAEELATLLSIHGHKYSAEQRATLIAHIRKMAGTINLANDDQASDFGTNVTGAGQATKKGQKGKTRTQPRQQGGKFGKKGKNNGEQAMGGPEVDPEQIIGTINNLQLGQSVSLLGNNAKVKRLANGYQLVKMDGTENKVVKDLGQATSWARSVMKRKVAQT